MSRSKTYPCVAVVPYKRKEQAFSRPVEEWSFMLYTSARCPGLLCQRGYKSHTSAYKAAVRTMGRLGYTTPEF